MRRFILGILFCFTFYGAASAASENWNMTDSSYTSVLTSSWTLLGGAGAMNISTQARTIDGIAVTFPGSADAFVEVWDWLDSTGTGKYLGKYRTSAAGYFPFHDGYGLRVSTGIAIYNQGTTPGGIRFDFTKKKPF